MNVSSKLRTFSRYLPAVLILLLAAPAGALAQSAQAPRGASTAPGTWAAGADLGFSTPTGDSSLDSDAQVNGSLEYFQTDQIAWRGTLSMHSLDGPSLPPPFRGTADVDLLAVTGNVVYHWKAAPVHPFVTGGVGLYDYDSDFGDDGAEFGTNFGGGIEIDLTRRAGIKVEGLFHMTTANEADTFLQAGAGFRYRF